MENVVAELKLIAEAIETKDRKEVTVRIGKPRREPENGWSACSAEYVGLFDSISDAIGDNDVHALWLASDVGAVLKTQRNKYRFYNLDGEPYFNEEADSTDEAFTTALYLMAKLADGCSEDRLRLIDDLIDDAALRDDFAKKFKETSWPGLRTRMFNPGSTAAVPPTTVL